MSNTNQVEKKDKLEHLFELQKTLQKRIEKIDKLPAVMPEKIPMQVTALIGEIGEILEEFQAWKAWRKNPPDYDREKLLLEVVDAYHFIINIALYLGFDADDIYDSFTKKNKVNHNRQDDNY
jgi:dimeric dUTPase (all-alpha-NTP-PPase superfamily)